MHKAPFGWIHREAQIYPVQLPGSSRENYRVKLEFAGASSIETTDFPTIMAARDAIDTLYASFHNV